MICSLRAKDKVILEEAYRSNPKPDKHARQQLVDRVSLSEKEVQVRPATIYMCTLQCPVRVHF